MLLRARGVFKGYICNRAVTTYEIRTLTMYVKQVYAGPIMRRMYVLEVEVARGGEKGRGRR